MSTVTAIAVESEIPLTNLETAECYDRRMRELESQILSTWHDAGSVALAMRNSNGWELLGYSSFNSWLMSAAPKSRSVVYAALNALEELQDIPAEELKELAHSTVHVLKKLPKDLRAKPEIRSAAKDLTTKEFTRKIKADHPELHIEEFARREFRFSETEEKDLEDAIKKAREEFELPTDDLALWAICVDYLQS